MFDIFLFYFKARCLFVFREGTFGNDCVIAELPKFLAICFLPWSLPAIQLEARGEGTKNGWLGYAVECPKVVSAQWCDWQY